MPNSRSLVPSRLAHADSKWHHYQDGGSGFVMESRAASRQRLSYSCLSSPDPTECFDYSSSDLWDTHSISTEHDLPILWVQLTLCQFSGKPRTIPSVMLWRPRSFTLGTPRTSGYSKLPSRKHLRYYLSDAFKHSRAIPLLTFARRPDRCTWMKPSWGIRRNMNHAT